MRKVILIILIAFVLSSCGESPVSPGSETAPVSSRVESSSESESGEPSSSPSQKPVIDPMFDTEEYLPAYDYDNRYMAFMRYVCDDENTVYFLKRNIGEGGKVGYYLCYYDKTKKISDVLCGKPECLHNDETCGGYAGFGCMPGLFLYDGKLHWIGYAVDQTGKRSNDFALYRCNPDGSNREQVIIMDGEDIFHTYSPQEFYLHRGYLYFVGQQSTVDDEGTAATLITIKGISLKNENENITILEKKYKGVCRPKLHFSGNRIFYFYGFREGEEVYGSICRYDIRTGETEEIWGEYLDEMDVRLTEQSFWVENDTIYAIFWHYENRSPEVTLKKLVNGSWTDAYVPEKTALLLLEGGGMLVHYKQEGEDPKSTKGVTICVRGLEGTLLYEGELPEKENVSPILCLGGTRDEVYIYLEIDEEGTCLVRADIRNQTPPELIIE